MSESIRYSTVERRHGGVVQVVACNGEQTELVHLIIGELGLPVLFFTQGNGHYIGVVVLVQFVRMRVDALRRLKNPFGNPPALRMTLQHGAYLGYIRLIHTRKNQCPSTSTSYARSREESRRW